MRSLHVGGIFLFQAAAMDNYLKMYYFLMIVVAFLNILNK
jgi:hypothetical protein